MKISDERGQALVELAVLTPILLFVMIAVVGLAQAGQRKAAVTRAAAAAARVAVVREDLAKSEALAVLRESDPSIASKDIAVSISSVEKGYIPFSTPKRVDVSYKYRPLSGFGWNPTFRLKSSFVYDKWSNAILFDVP